MSGESLSLAVLFHRHHCSRRITRRTLLLSTLRLRRPRPVRRFVKAFPVRNQLPLFWISPTTWATRVEIQERLEHPRYRAGLCRLCQQRKLLQTRSTTVRQRRVIDGAPCRGISTVKDSIAGRKSTKPCPQDVLVWMPVGPNYDRIRLTGQDRTLAEHHRQGAQGSLLTEGRATMARPQSDKDSISLSSVAIPLTAVNGMLRPSPRPRRTAPWSTSRSRHRGITGS
jgi:hypothetical protein